MTLPWLRVVASALALASGALFGPLACNSDSTTTVGVTHPTMIEVSPATFLGDRVCADEAGGVRRYVATLFDVTDDGAGGADGAGSAGPGEAVAGADDGASATPERCGGFQLPSSEPVSCLASVGFGFVVSGRRYCAEVDAYDTDQLEPRGNGTRMMVAGDPSDGEAPSLDAAKVVPRWQTSCAAGSVAATSQIVPARGCLPLSSELPATEPTTLRVETSGLLGDLKCGSEPDQVGELVVELEPIADYTLGNGLQVTCGEAAVYTGLPPGRVVSAYVQAFETGGVAAMLPAIAGAQCHGLTRPNVGTVAECAELSTSGTLRVDFQAALEALGMACDASLADVRVNVPGELGERRFPPPDCLQPFDHGFPVGDAAVTVTVVPKDGPATSVNCGKTIEPGSLVVADCTP